jgi:hypothetical protein
MACNPFFLTCSKSRFRNTSATTMLAIALGTASGAHAEPPCRPVDPDAEVNFGVAAEVHALPFFGATMDSLFGEYSLCAIQKSSEWTFVLYKRDGAIYSGLVSNNDIGYFSALARFNNRWLGGVNW